MTAASPALDLERLVSRLTQLPRETEWVEFKVNNGDPKEVGEYVSALANSALLHGRDRAYLVWGVQDGDHEIVGTTFAPLSARRGGEALQNWIVRLLEPQIAIRFHEGTVGGKKVAVLEIPAAAHRPIRFSGDAFIRNGSYKKPLAAHPELEARLWEAIARTTFESGIAADEVTSSDVLRLLNYPAYFQLIGSPLPSFATGILEALEAEDFIRTTDSGLWNITNLGAILYAQDLKDFPSTSRKAPRVIRYRGDNKMESLGETEWSAGYAPTFRQLIQNVMGLVPKSEVIDQALRREVPMYPELAIRELIANALVHQDFSMAGSSPMIELYESRIEITNPGSPLLDPDRFLDAPPRSRNEALASQMRRIGVCEERGSGWDKIAFQIEFYQLPAPLIAESEGFTRVTLFSPRPLTALSKEERNRAIYLHACLKYVGHEQVTNTSVRERFKIDQRNSATASRLIKEAVDAGLIVLFDETAGPKNRRYVPFWAAESVGR